MVTINYLAIDPDAVELVNSAEFLAVLEAHPEFKLVWVGEDDEGDETFIPVELPFPDGQYEPLAVMNMVTGDEFFWALNDGECSIENPSPAAIAFLKVIDNFSVQTEGARIFLSSGEEWDIDSPEALQAEFDFTTSKYVL